MNAVVCGTVPKVLTGFGDVNFGKQYRQGNRVYDGDSVAMCLTAQPLGNAGGYSYLYLLKDKDNRLCLKK